MAIKLSEIISLLTGRFVMPGWLEVVSKTGEKMIVRDFIMSDGIARCIGVSVSHAVIYSGKYDKALEFMDKPQHYIIVVNGESIGRHMDKTCAEEVLEAYRRISLVENN